MSERELEYAKMEARTADAEDAYFQARPSLDDKAARRIFRAAFERGWDAAWPRRPMGLTDEEISAIADEMPGGIDGFCKGWGWQQFARAIESEILPVV